MPAYELVLEQLRRSIDQGHFAPGDKLPPERDLARQLGVSRTTLREAVRVLEGERAVEVRRGSAGGIVVQRASSARERRARMREFDEIIDFRLAIEPTAARLAAERRTRTDVAALSRALARLDALAAHGAEGRFGDWLRADSDYHVLIGKAARNGRLAAAIETARAGMFNPVGAVWGASRRPRTPSTPRSTRRSRRARRARRTGDGDAHRGHPRRHRSAGAALMRPSHRALGPQERGQTRTMRV